MKMHSDFNYAFVFSLLTVAFALLFVWYYKKYVQFYYQFPSISLLAEVTKYFFKSKEKTIPLTSYVLQTGIDICKKFQSEGLFMFWIQRPFLCIFDEEAVKVFSNEHSTINKVIEFEILEEVFGTGLLTSNGDLWRKRKKLLNPIFHTAMVKDKVSIVNKNAAMFIEKLKEVSNEPSIEILKLLQFCSFMNISEFLIGQHLHNSRKYAQLEKIMATISRATEMCVNRIVKPWLHPKFMMRLFPKGREYLRMVGKARRTTKEILIEIRDDLAKAKREEREELDEESRPSFTQVLIEHHMKDPSFTFEDMLHEFNTFISAGYDAVSYGMMWSLFLVGHHPEVQEKIYDEVETVLGNDMTYQDLINFRYLDCVIKEALRLYPPIPVYARRLVKPVTCGKYKVPRGTNIVFFPYMTHRNPKTFPNPEKFDPDRFSYEHTDKKPTTYSFAEGMRNCLGKKFAEIELKITLSHIIKNFKIKSLDRREDIHLNWEGFLTTVEPLRVQLSPREKNINRN